MATTYTLIEKVTTTNNQASVTLGSGGTIPQTYTDLKVLVSTRSVAGGQGADSMRMTFNGASTNFESQTLYGTGSSFGAFGGVTSWGFGGAVEGAIFTASTFSSTDIYLPNYTTSNFKSWSSDCVTENNATESYQYIAAGLWANTAAITYITFSVDPGNGATGFAANSTFSLYGIKNA
jgi:hypothetical protein